MTLFRLRDHVHAMPREDFHNAMFECFSESRAGRASTSSRRAIRLRHFEQP